MARKRKKRDYGPKKYSSNPLFGNKRKRPSHKKSKLNLLMPAVILSVFLSMGSLAWLALFSEHFKIKNLDISITGTINNEELKEKFWQQTKGRRLFFPESNYFVFNSGYLERKLRDEYNLESIKVSRGWPDKIRIEAVLKKYSLAWTEAQRYFFLDEFGNIVQETGQNDPELKKFAIVVNEGKSRIKDKRIDIDREQLKFILALYAELPAFNKLFQYDKFIMDSNLHTIKLATKQGPMLMFNTNESLNNQIAKLNTVLKEKIRKNFSKKHYIDLRYGDMVYIQ